MSWDTWCDRALVNSCGRSIGSGTGIFCRKTGAPWGVKPATFQIPPEAVLAIVQHLEGTRQDGVEFGNVKYMYLRTLEDQDCKYAMFKYKTCGLTAALGNQCVIIGQYGDGMQAGAHADAVFKVMVQLKVHQY